MNFYKNPSQAHFKIHLMNNVVIPEFLLYKKKNICLGLDIYIYRHIDIYIYAYISIYIFINKGDIVISLLIVNTCFG